MIRVAAYCRVSTDHEDQVNSLVSQKKFFEEYIRHHEDQILFKIYADEGVTGTSTKKRAQFNQMMRDAHSGCFDMIITKEVSRFSRNILDTIMYTRELKQLGIGVRFMSDGFCSLDPDAELRLSIMGSIAQEESRKTSVRVKWGQTRQMERGVVFGRSLLGYDVQGGTITVEPEGAGIVKTIFEMYGIENMGTTEIARRSELSWPGVRQWSPAYILKILKNEKYAGDLIQKKSFTPDHLTHEKKRNQGEEDMIILKDHHEPIIERKLWQLVQTQIDQRRRKRNRSSAHSTSFALSGKIVCGECGARFIARTKTRKDGSSYRRWMCYRASAKDLSCDKCDVGKVLRDDLVNEMVMRAYKTLEIDHDHLQKEISMLLKEASKQAKGPCDSPERINRRLHELHRKRLDAIEEHLSGMITRSDLNDLIERFDKQQAELAKRLRDHNTAEYDLPETEITTDLPAEIVSRILLERVTVYKNGKVDIKMKGLQTVWYFSLRKGAK